MVGPPEMIVPIEPFEHLDRGVADILAVSGTPSLSYTIVQHGKTLHTRHFGFRDVSQGLAPDDQTRYNINSMSKGLVSAVAAIIASTGAVDLYSPVKKYIPEFACYDPNLSNEITLIDLLSHRTGLTSYDPIWLGSQNSILLGRGEIIKTFATLKPCMPFRASFLYNNWGYEVVGMVLEVVTGKSLDVLLQDHIFEPLGMTRTSTSWDLDEANTTKSYTVLRDLSAVPTGRPQLGRGTLMEAAGGVKSTIEDLAKLYSAYLDAIIDQASSGKDSTPGSVFRGCLDIVTNHARLPGTSLHEQGYGAGFARAQLPGQLGRISLNVLLGPEPIAGKGAEPTLVVYHHGSMPGSTSCVHLVPSLNAFIVVLQNSLAPIDTADFVCQYLLEGVIQSQRPNDYARLAADYTSRGFSHMDRIKQELDSGKGGGTHTRPLAAYTGRYWNSIKNFFIEVSEAEGRLRMSFQGRESETFDLAHYDDDTFSWWMPYDEIVRRGRYVSDYEASYYLIRFSSSGGEGVDTISWAWDPNLPQDPGKFVST